MNTINSINTISNNQSSIPKNTLGKDDFLKLLLLELQNQDPTSPMDADKILSQTSQLATLESTENTNKALENLANALNTSMQFNGISSIGKIADTGSNAIVYNGKEQLKFKLYFPEDVSNGNINIMNNNGDILKTISINNISKGNSVFEWDGKDNYGHNLEEGTYYVESKYFNNNNENLITRLGLYPIEAVKFDSGKTYVKLADNYIDFSQIKEITN